MLPASAPGAARAVPAILSCACQAGQWGGNGRGCLCGLWATELAHIGDFCWRIGSGALCWLVGAGAVGPQAPRGRADRTKPSMGGQVCGARVCTQAWASGGARAGPASVDVPGAPSSGGFPGGCRPGQQGRRGDLEVDMGSGRPAQPALSPQGILSRLPGALASTSRGVSTPAAAQGGPEIGCQAPPSPPVWTRTPGLSVQPLPDRPWRCVCLTPAPLLSWGALPAIWYWGCPRCLVLGPGPAHCGLALLVCSQWRETAP